MEQNIIASSCVGAYIMRDYLHQQFNNPFIWCATEHHSMLYLINNYDTINWFNVSMRMSNGFKPKSYPILTIDNSVDVKFVHYRFSWPDKKLRKDSTSTDVFYRFIYRFTLDKYFTRVQRMLSCGIPPIFVWAGSWDSQQPTKDEFRQINTKYRVVLCPEALQFNGRNSLVAQCIMNSHLI